MEEKVEELIDLTITLGDVSTNIMLDAFNYFVEKGDCQLVIQVRCDNAIGRKVDRIFAKTDASVEDIDNSVQYTLSTTIENFFKAYEKFEEEQPNSQGPNQVKMIVKLSIENAQKIFLKQAQMMNKYESKCGNDGVYFGYLKDDHSVSLQAIKTESDSANEWEELRENRQLMRENVLKKEKNPIVCHGCGEIGHIRPKCPKKKLICHNCGREGHKKIECKYMFFE